MTAADINLAMLLKRSLEDPQAAVAEGHSVVKANRAAKPLQSTYDRWQAAERAAARYRHVSAPTAERDRVRALEAFAECAVRALNLGDGK